MTIEETRLKGCFLINDHVLGDSRGYFLESFNQRDFSRLTGVETAFVQDNQSRSSKGVLRGMHLQRGEFAQAKLVRVLEGAVQDVVMDCRPGSETFGEHLSVDLSADSKTQLYIPRGFAHGFLVLSETATFFYKVDNYYQKDSEIGFMPLDKASGIDWELPGGFILSEKDKALPTFSDFFKNL